MIPVGYENGDYCRTNLHNPLRRVMYFFCNTATFIILHESPKEALYCLNDNHKCFFSSKGVPARMMMGSYELQGLRWMPETRRTLEKRKL